MYKKVGDNRGLTRNWFKCLYKSMKRWAIIGDLLENGLIAYIKV